ncbi:MAG: hypothetical protein BGO77_03040 [Caedibacter sp. 37-49]|nr:MAG: hypothetical protein BGO77_03040 [Caedibacter sp. 37-49]
MLKSKLLILFIISLIPCCIEVDISAPSFPEIARYFNVSEGKVELTIAYNFFGFWISSLIYGPLSECYGRRRIMIVGNTLLLVGAFGCGMASTMDQLLGWRFIQGLGASTSAVLVFAMVADIYKGQEAVRIISIMNATLTLILAIAPVVGSVINQLCGWRGNYYVVWWITLISWVLLFKQLPETKKNLRRFLFKKIYQDYMKLFNSLEFMFSSLVPSLFYGCYVAFITSAPFLYMKTFNLPIFTYACHQALIIGIFSGVSLFSTQFVKHFGKKHCIIWGVSMAIISISILNTCNLFELNYPLLITGCMVVFCIGFALCYPLIFTISLELFPTIKGPASSLTMALRAFICAMVVGLTSIFYNGNPFSLFFIILMVTIVIFLITKYYLLKKVFNFHDNKK